MMLPTLQTDIDGHSLRYFVLGEHHKEVLLLLHGYPDNLQVWHRLAPLLAARFRVIGIDWPGMGQSADIKGGATPLAKAKKLHKIIDHLGFDQVSLLAQDMGGQAALVFASEFPEKVKAVSVMNSLLMWNERTSWEIEWLRKFKFNQFIIQHFPKLVFERAIHTFVKESSAVSPELKAELWSSFRSKAVRKYVVRMCAGYEAQLKRLPDYYAQISCPVQLIWAENGKHFAIGHAHRFKEICPQTQLHIIKGAAHWMVLEEDEAIARIVLSS